MFRPKFPNSTNLELQNKVRNELLYGSPGPQRTVINTNSAAGNFTNPVSHVVNQDSSRIINNRNNFQERKIMNDSINSSFIGMPSTSKKFNPNETLSRDEDIDTVGAAPQLFGGSNAERKLVLSGTVERVIKWRTYFQNHFCYFVVVGQIIAMQEGSIRMQKVLIVRDKNKGPILQVFYYTASTYMNIEDFHLGQMLRCAGTMIGPNMLSAHSIRSATDEELETLQRHCCLSDRAIAHFIRS